MDSQTSFFKSLDAEMWKGSARSDAFPHRCPLNPNGVDRKTCIELSGAGFERNRNSCCGTQRNGIEFPPCNSEERRCIACLEMGRRGAKAGAVTDVERGLCDEHQGKAAPAPPPTKRVLAAPLPRSHAVGIIAPTPPPPPTPPSPPATTPEVVPEELSDEDIGTDEVSGEAVEVVGKTEKIPAPTIQKTEGSRRQPLTHREPNENAEVDPVRVSSALQNAGMLTRRQREILLHLATAETDEQLATAAGLMVSTIAPVLSDLCKKLGLSDIKRGLKRRTLTAVAKGLANATPSGQKEDAEVVPLEYAKQAPTSQSDSADAEEESGENVRPPAISEAEIELGARRVELLPQATRDIIELAAEGLENIAISERLNVPYGNVTSEMSFAYRVFELNKVADFKDKRAAMVLIVRRSRDLEAPRTEVSALQQQASTDRKRFEELELLVNQLLDIGESVLKLIHGRRHTDL